MHLINYLKQYISRRTLQYISRALILGRKYPLYLEKFTGNAGKFKKNKEILNWISRQAVSGQQTNNNSLVISLEGASNIKTPFSLELDQCGHMNEVSDKKILFIWNFKGNSLVSEVFLNLINSAQDSKIEVCSIDSETATNTESKNKIISDILNMKPDLILLQLHAGLNHNTTSLLNFEDINYIVSKTGSKLAILCFDIWRQFDRNYVVYWSQLNPTFLHIDPDSVKLLPPEISKMFLAWPYIEQSVKNYGNPSNLKLKSVFFSGSIKFQDRRYWLNALNLMCINSNIEMRLNIFNYTKRGKRLPEIDYKDELKKSLAIISFSRKSEEHCVIPFRAFQAVANGILVLQETQYKQANLGYFYAPFFHFLPFSSPTELNLGIEWLSNNAEIANEMAKSALNFHEANYFPERLWKYLFHKIG